ncbi:MAG: spore germination protein [Clostridiales bacterium]|nr:spore germination protein [Clostridiales bacterium]
MIDKDHFYDKSKQTDEIPEMHEEELDDVHKKDTDPGTIPSFIEEYESSIKNIFSGSSDLVIESFSTRTNKVLVGWIDGMIDKNIADRDIIAPLKSVDFNGDVAASIKSIYKTVDNIPEAVTEILNGNIAVFFDNFEKVFIVDIKQWDRRVVETPEAEGIVRGPKEGFTENIRTNTTLIRRKIKNRNLVFENMTLGRQTNTEISIVYVKGIVNKDVLKELKKRLSQIDTGAILESGHIEQLIEKHTFSPVSEIGVTQKPDVVAGLLLEGRVAILCDGTPHVLTVPELFIEHLQSREDYYNRVLYSSITQILRYLGLLITVMLPGLSVAIITYHPEMIPSAFLSNFITSTLQTPLPLAAEAFFLILMFELLKELGARLPKMVGLAITIFGLLLIGDAAVKAGIFGTPMIIIIALTGVAGFIVPNLAEFVIVYRLIFLFLGSAMGLIGIGCALFFMLVNLISSESFGIPILDSFTKYESKDGVLPFPLKTIKYRPSVLVKENKRRTKY